MKKLALLCLLIVPLLGATPQGTAPEGFQHWTSASLERMNQELHAKVAANPNQAATQQLCAQRPAF